MRCTGERRQRILVAGGDQQERRALRQLLNAMGFEVLLAVGEDALALIERCEIDLVLVERWLAAADGLSLLWCIKADYPSVPVIVMSDDETVATIVEAMRMGAEDYLAKPLRIGTLLMTVARAIARATSA